MQNHMTAIISHGGVGLFSNTLAKRVVRRRTSVAHSAGRTKAIAKVEALPPRTQKARVLLQFYIKEYFSSEVSGVPVSESPGL